VKLGVHPQPNLTDDFSVNQSELDEFSKNKVSEIELKMIRRVHIDDLCQA